jgi:ribosomal-protein-alanine N-acetyltransferase
MPLLACVACSAHAFARNQGSFVPGELGASAEDHRAVRERSLREELTRTWARLRAIRDESGTVLGYTLFWHVVDEVHLLNGAVAVRARRQGLGRALMLDLLADARGNAVVRILLEVRASNTSLSTTTRWASPASTSARPRYYSDDEDAIELQLLI